MIGILGVLVVSISILLIELPNLRAENNRKDMFIFWSLMLFSTGLGLAVTLQLKIPNPTDWISFIYRPLSDLFIRTFM